MTIIHASIDRAPAHGSATASRRTRALRLLPLAACTIATLFTVTTAQAQLLGRMKRAVQERVQEPPRNGGGNEGNARNAAARIEITPERLDAFVIAMQPLVQRAREVQAERDGEAVHARREKEYNVCVERQLRATNGATAPMTPELVEKLGTMTEQMTQMMGRYNDAAAAGQVASLYAILDSADALGARARIMQYPALASCGMPAPRPVKSAPLPANQGELIAAGAGGMTAGEFGRLRERVAVYVITQGNGDTYSDGERSTLESHTADLAALAPLFRSGVLDWAQWGSLASAWRAR